MAFFWRPKRSRAAFETQMLPHLDSAYSLARWLLQRPDEAEDAVQDAYMRAINAFDQYQGGEARAWLLAIVRNVCLTQLRRRGARDNVIVLGDAWDRAELSAASAELPADLKIERREDSDRVRAAIAALPEALREVVVLREIEGMSYRDIATVIGVPIGTVMSRLARARDRLAQILDAVRPTAAGGQR